MRLHAGRTTHDPYAARLSRLNPFAASSSTELRTIAHSCTIVTCKSGAILAREGGASREFLVIGSGAALVTRDGVPDVVLRAGDSFGDADLLAKRESSAGLVALSDVELVVMSGGEFVALLDTAPSFRTRVVKALAERARANDAAHEVDVTQRDLVEDPSTG